MALRVWLPLNGTLDNIGISDVTVTNNGATVDDNGKIGKCYSFDGTDDWIKVTMPSGMTSLKNCSIALWGMGNNSFGGISHDGGATLATCTMFDGRWQLANGSWTYINGGTRSTTVWHHFAITISEDTITTYYDGTQVTSTALASNIVTDITSSNFIEIGCDHPGGDEYGTIKVNDFRIYDHCLSAKEVKEISQGLVLHYKLDGWSGGINQNLALDTANKICTATGAATNIGLDYGLQSNYNLIRGKKITISADIILENAATSLTSGSRRVGFEPAIKYSDNTIQYMGYWIGLDSTPKTLSGRYSTTVTVQDKDFQSIAQNGAYIQGLTSGTATIKNIKVELGDKATPWSPAPQDLGIDITKVTDSSGYGYDGTITGTVSTFSNSNRYENSAIFNGNCANFIANVGFPKITKDITFSCWAYQTSATSTSGTNTSNNRQYLISQGRDSVCSGFNLTVSSGTALLDMGVSSTGGSSLSSGISILNGWHMITGTFDGTNMKIYIDGILKGTKNPGVTEIDYTYGSEALVVGKMSYGYTSTASYFPFAGYINDVRVYATALSAEDILDLYHTPANIDNLQNIHAFELKEQSGNMFAGSPMTGTVTWDATNNYYTITSNPSTSTWGIGPAVGTSPKKIIPWGMSYILTYEVYSPTAAQWYIDYNNNDPTTSLSGNDNDNGRLRTGVNVPANTWTLITYGCSNTNETKNPDHLPLYDYSTGLGPVMTNISSAITWHMRNPQWYLVDADNKEHIYESGVFQANFIKEDNQSLYTSFRNEEKQHEHMGI